MSKYDAAVEAGHAAKHLFHYSHLAHRVAHGLAAASVATAGVPTVASALGVGASAVTLAVPVLAVGVAVCGVAAAVCGVAALGIDAYETFKGE